MIDPKILRTQYNLIVENLNKRGYPLQFLENYKKIDEEWRLLLNEVENLRAKQKQLTPKGKPTPEQLQELSELSQTIKTKNDQLQTLEKRVRDAAYNIPNLLSEDVPKGESDIDNPEIKKWGTLPSFSFEPLSHDVIAERLDWIDFERGAKISGARFSVFKGIGSKLERAIISLMLDTHTKNGYIELSPPVLVNTDSLLGTGQLPKFAEDQFKIQDTDLWLSPTAEVQLTNFYRNEIIEETKLPIKLTAYTACFRKEAGSYGKDLKGLIRQHQFDKVELVKFVMPETSEIEHEKLLNDAEKILQLLEIPYRIVKLCSKDTGFCSAKTYDIEVWLPSQNRYREISSCSNFLDFQARRAMLRYKLGNTTGYLHTINGSGLAVGRTFAAICENYQQEDGNIKIPSVLQKYFS